MTLEQRLDAIETSAGKQDALVRHLRDAVTVTAELEACHGRLMVDLANEAAAHATWLKKHQEALDEHDRAMKVLDERIAGMVSGIGKLITRLQ